MADYNRNRFWIEAIHAMIVNWIGIDWYECVINNRQRTIMTLMKCELSINCSFMSEKFIYCAVARCGGYYRGQRKRHCKRRRRSDRSVFIDFFAVFFFSSCFCAGHLLFLIFSPLDLLNYGNYFGFCVVLVGIVVVVVVVGRVYISFSESIVDRKYVISWSRV